MNMPKTFYGDATVTSRFLINQMPSTVPSSIKYHLLLLTGKTPFSTLFPRQPSFSVIPRVFGHVCFAHQHQPGIDKLDPRALKCIFLVTLFRKMITARVVFYDHLEHSHAFVSVLSENDKDFVLNGLHAPLYQVSLKWIRKSNRSLTIHRRQSSRSTQDEKFTCADALMIENV